MNWNEMYVAGSDSTVCLQEKFLTLPELMREDTQAGKKELYIDITSLYREIYNKVTVEQTGMFLATLVDTLEYMSFEIYELYRELQDIFKSVMKKYLSADDQGTKDNRRKAAYAILKACRMGLVLQEKYVPVAAAMADELLADAGKEEASALREERMAWKSK
jgi:hypothetical protein